MVTTWESAPSAVCSRPMPSDAFWLDWVRAEMFAPNPSAIERPAGSSAPELILNPVESCVRVFWRLFSVAESAFSATSEETLLRTLIIVLLLYQNPPAPSLVPSKVQNRYLGQVVFIT